MGVTSLVLGIMGVCICWLPYVGWLGMAMGAGAGVLGVMSITHWFERPGYLGWGIAGMMLSTVAISMGLAYQIKHTAGALDDLVYPLPTPLAYYVLGAGLLLVVLGLALARLKSRTLGMLIGVLAIIGLDISGGWALTTADRALVRAEATDSQLDSP